MPTVLHPVERYHSHFKKKSFDSGLHHEFWGKVNPQQASEDRPKGNTFINIHNYVSLALRKFVRATETGLRKIT